MILLHHVFEDALGSVNLAPGSVQLDTLHGSRSGPERMTATRAWLETARHKQPESCSMAEWRAPDASFFRERAERSLPGASFSFIRARMRSAPWKKLRLTAPSSLESRLPETKPVSHRQVAGHPAAWRPAEFCPRASAQGLPARLPPVTPE